MTKQGLTMRGFYRIKLGEKKNGKEIIVGNSGWLENEVTNLGFQNFVVNLIGKLAGSVQVGMVVIGTGGAPATGDTALAGEQTRQTCGNAAVASKTMRATAAIASGAHPGGTPDIANIALINSVTTGGTIMCGNTYSSSTWNSNQGLSATYELRFGTA